MKAVVFVVALLALTAFAAPLTSSQYEFLFTRFVEQYKKSYETNSFFQKFNTFKANLDFILAENAKGLSYTVAMNEFGDLTREEFKAKFLGLTHFEAPYLNSHIIAADGEVSESLATAADSFDWRNQGAVTPVKNQGQCGSCWAFSATGAIEGAWKIKSGSLVSLSEQQLVDCAGSTGNYGCNGGLMTRAFEWVIKNGGICSEADYPYTARGGNCQKTCKPVAKLTSYKALAASEAALMTALQSTPVSIAVEADRQAFQFYSSGILDDASCGTQLDHGILAVGWGVQSGKQYWAIKNSWGTSWGEQGYIRFVRNKNQCGIAGTLNTYPIA